MVGLLIPLELEDTVPCTFAGMQQNLLQNQLNSAYLIKIESSIYRGEFQYKKVKIPAEEWYENTKEIWKQNELIYIATDERNKTFFDPIAKHHSVRFLDDYMDLAGLRDLGRYCQSLALVVF